jgi:hypothetical protein
VEEKGAYAAATRVKVTRRNAMPFALFEAYVAGEVGQLRQAAAHASRRRVFSPRWPWR